MKHKITSKVYLKVHPQDNEMVELYRDTIRRWTDEEGKNRVRTETSVFAVMHIDLFEGDVFNELTDENADPDDYTEIEFNLVHPRPKRSEPDDGYGDWLYDQRRDDLLTGDA